MNPGIRFFFDECLSRPVVETQITDSLRLYGSDAEVAHLLTKFGRQGVKDSEWVAQLAREGSWVVLSVDQGRRSKKSEKLPSICRAFGVTHVMLSSSIHRRNMYVKAMAIENHWEKLLGLAAVPRGTGYQIKISGKWFKMEQSTEGPSVAEIIDPHAPQHQSKLSFGDTE